MIPRRPAERDSLLHGDAEDGMSTGGRSAWRSERNLPFWRRTVRLAVPFPVFVLAVVAVFVLLHLADPVLWGTPAATQRARTLESHAATLTAMDLTEIKGNLHDCVRLHSQNNDLMEVVQRLEREVAKLEVKCRSGHRA